MKVVLVNTVKDRGGAAKMAVTLLHALHRHNPKIQPEMIHFGDDVASGRFIGLGRRWQAYAMALQTRILGSGNIYDFGVSQKIAAVVRGADVVHLHNLHGYYVNYRSLLDLIRNKPLVWTWHDMWGATGRCGFAAGCERWVDSCAPCPRKDQYPAAWIDHSGQERDQKFLTFSSVGSLRIVCPSEWLADIAMKRGYPQESISVIPNPADTETFRFQSQLQARRRLGLDPLRPLAMFIAERCDDPRKGYPDFCAATQQIDCDAIAIGAAPKNGAAHIKHFGRIESKARLADFYSAADVMVIPSYADNYPNTVVESLLSGTPVIGYEEGGIPGQLTDPWSVVSPRGDRSCLAQALQAFVTRIDYIRACREELAKLSRARWSLDVVAKEYVRVYEQVMPR